MVCNVKSNSQVHLASDKAGSSARPADGVKLTRGTTAKAIPRSKGSTVTAMTFMVVLIFSLDTILLEWIPSAVAGWKFEDNSLLVYLLSIGGGYILFPLFCYCRSRRSGKGETGRAASSTSRSGNISGSGAADDKATKPAQRQSWQLQRRLATACGDPPSSSPSTGSNADGGRAAPAPNTLSRLNHAVSQAAAKGDAEKAGLLLDNLTSMGWESEAASYNIVIRAYAKRGEMRRAEEWIAKMRTCGIGPNEHSYIGLMAACAKADDLSGAEAWQLRMTRDGVAATCISYAVLIHACARLGKIERAELWLRRMIEAGVEPDAANYNSLIHACSVQGNVSLAEKWLDEMKAKGLEPTVLTYTALIDACAKALDVHKAEKWLECMQDMGIEPNVVSYSTMINACAKVGNLARAEHLVLPDGGTRSRA